MEQQEALKILTDDGWVAKRPAEFYKIIDGKNWWARIIWSIVTGYYIEMAEVHYLEGDSTPYLNTGIYQYIYDGDDPGSIFEQLKNMGKH